MSFDDYNDNYLLVSDISSTDIWAIIALVIAILGGICLYFTVFSDQKKDAYTGFMAKLYDFVKFKKMFLTSFLKIMYIISALFVTLTSFGIISTNFLAFLVVLVVGNIVIRVCYEFALVLLGIYENTNEMVKNKKSE